MKRIHLVAVALGAFAALSTSISPVVASPSPDVSTTTRKLRTSTIGAGGMGEIIAMLETSGGAEMRVGTTKKMIVHVVNGKSQTVSGLSARIAVSRGTQVVGVSKMWTCKPLRTSQTSCTYRDKAHPGERVLMSLVVMATKTAKPGKKSITIRPFAQKYPNTAVEKHSFQVIDDGDAVMRPVVRYGTVSSVSTKTAKSSAKKYTAYVGRPYSYKVVIKNVGHVSLNIGERVTATQKFSNGMKILSVKSASASKCSVSQNRWTCPLVSTKVVKPLTNLDVISVVVLPTAATTGMQSNPVSVKAHSTKLIKKESVKLHVVVDKDPVSIHMKELHRAHVGGTSTVEITLENRSKALIPRGHEVEVRLPKGVSIVTVKGKSWACRETDSNRLMKCAYSRSVSAGKFSNVLMLTNKLGKQIKKGVDSYAIEVASSKGWTRHSIAVEAAPDAKTKSGLVRQADGGYAIGLEGEILATNNHRYESRWVQRCTTADDAKTTICPENRISKNLKLVGATEQSASALVPAGTLGATYVFEYRVVSKSVTSTRIVKVKVPTTRVRASNVSSMSTPPPAIPTEYLSALANIGVKTTGPAVASSSTSLLSQPAKLTGAIAVQLGTFGFRGSITYNSATDTSSTCATASLDTSDAPGFNSALSVSDFVIVASRGSSCTYNGNLVQGGASSFTLNMFGTKVSMFQKIDPTNYSQNIAFSANLDTLNYPLLNNSFTFKNVSLILNVNAAIKTVSVTLGVNMSLFGETFLLGGELSLNYKTQELIGDLVVQQGKNITFDGVTLSNFSFGTGISYQLFNPDTAFNVTASGAISFMGQSIALKEMSVDIIGDAIVGADIDFAVSNHVQGAYSLDGDLGFTWHAPKPSSASSPSSNESISILGTVVFSAGGFQVGTQTDPAVFSWDPACIMIQGGVVIPGILSADITGVMRLSASLTCQNLGLALGATGVLAELPSPSIPGDFRFDAENVQFSALGLGSTGNFSFGQFGGLPFGKVDVTTKLTTRSVNASVYVKGDFSPLTGFDLVGKTNLDIAGYTLSTDVEVAMTPTSQKIALSGSLDIGGVKVALAGSVAIVDVDGVPVPAISLSGSGDFKVDGYDLGSASFTLDESPTKTGLAATTKINLGVLAADGAFSFYTVPGGVAYKIGIAGKLSLGGTTLDVTVSSSNCNDWTVCNGFRTAYMNLYGGATFKGRTINFGWFPIDTSGKFSVSMSEKGSLTVTPPYLKVLFDYSFTAGISNVSPYLTFDTDLEARGYLRYEQKWYKEVDYESGITLNLDPFYMSVHFCITSKYCDTYKATG